MTTCEGASCQRIHTSCEAETMQVGRDVAEGLPDGGVVLLTGELGVGKTAFVRGLVDAVGGNPSDVSSPTFTLIQPYAGRLTVQHVDLYRVRPAEVEDLGLDELVAPATIVAVEWAERWQTPRPGAVLVEIVDCGGDQRDLHVRWPDDRPPARSRYSLR